MHKSTSLQLKMFNIIVAVMGSVSVISIIGNYISGFPSSINIKWLLLICVSLFYFFIWRKYWNQEIFQFVFMILTIYIILPYGWMDSGGSSNNTIAYMFLIVLCITYLFRGRQRLFLIVSLIFVFIVLFSLEYYYPSILKNYSSTSQFIDRLIQIPITLLCSALLVKRFTDAHDEETVKIQNYAKQLKEANQKLEFIAQHDVLTKCYNRRAFDNMLNHCILTQSFVYVLLFDIDKFKAVNDTYGHDFGDQCLIQVAHCAKKVMPKSTYISRWGGDEFAFIYFNDSKHLFEDLDSFVHELDNLELIDNFSLSLSIGISKLLADDTLESIFHRVDQALYKAKNGGGKQYVFL